MLIVLFCFKQMTNKLSPYISSGKHVDLSHTQVFLLVEGDDVFNPTALLHLRSGKSSATT